MLDRDAPQLSVSVKLDADRVAVVKPVGTLTMRSAIHLRRVLEKCLADTPAAMIVDLSRLRVSSIPLLALFATVARRHDSPHAVVLAAPRPEIRRWMRAAALASVTVHDSVTRALVFVGQTPPPRRRRELKLPPDHGSPAFARRFVRTACVDWSLAHIADAAAVVVSELVSNVVRHARTPMWVVIFQRGAYLFIVVRDQIAAGALPARSPRPLGKKPVRGLYLVDVYVSTRGVVWMPDGKRVWASIRTKPVGVR